MTKKKRGRGRPATPRKVLERRGSWVARAREKEEAEAAAPAKARRRGRRVSQKALEDVLRLIPGYDPYRKAEAFTFDAKAACAAINFFHRKLIHVKGEKAGKPFVLRDWQQAIIANLFGWKRKDGTRRYRRGLCYVPRKNGKSTMAAGIVNYVLFEDNEPGAEIYSIAAEAMQARLVWDQAAEMIRREPELKERARIFRGYKCIERKDVLATYRAISADAHTKHGYNIHCAVIDELHAQPNRELVDVVETSTGSRRQPLLFYITTADYDRESICNETYDYACKVRDGVIDDAAFLPVIYEATREEDWTSPDVWAKANPNLGVSLSEDYLKRECGRAREMPAYENTFKRLHLNTRTEQATRWLQLVSWDACQNGINTEKLKGQRCFAGLDLSSTTDITALVLLFPEAGNAVLPFFWIPADNARERERRDRVPYETWARAGLIEQTPGNVVDYGFIRQRLLDLSKTYDIVEVAYDPWNARQLAIQLAEQDGLPMVEFRQGFYSMNEPCKRLEALIRGGKLRHSGHPVLRWMASNVAIRTDPAGCIKPDKERSTEKIDGIVSLAMALGCSMIRGIKSVGSVYETRGMLQV